MAILFQSNSSFHFQLCYHKRKFPSEPINGSTDTGMLQNNHEADLTNNANWHLQNYLDSTKIFSPWKSTKNDLPL